MKSWSADWAFMIYLLTERRLQRAIWLLIFPIRIILFIMIIMIWRPGWRPEKMSLAWCWEMASRIPRPVSGILWTMSSTRLRNWLFPWKWKVTEKNRNLMQWIFPVRRARYFSMICGQESFLIKEKKKKAGISQVFRKMRTGINPFWQIGQEEKRSCVKQSPLQWSKKENRWKSGRALWQIILHGEMCRKGCADRPHRKADWKKRAVTFMILERTMPEFSAWKSKGIKDSASISSVENCWKTGL